MRSVLPGELPLRVLQMTFAAPVSAGAVRVRSHLLRSGRSATHVEARLLSGDDVAAVVVAVFGSSRPSRARVVPEQPPVTGAREPLTLPYLEGLTPRFLQHFDVCWLAGDPPFSGSSETRAVIRVGLRDEGPVRAEHVLAIADAPPPLALSLLTERAPGSTMTWTFELLTESVSHLPLEGYRLDAEIVAGADGYTSQSVMIWGPGGEPVALSRQSMVVFG
jgi:hypothetical protein